MGLIKIETMELRKTLGKNVRRLRKSKGLSQKDLAELINCSPGIISRIENGKMLIGVKMLVQMARYFLVSVDELIYPEGTVSPLKNIKAMLSLQSEERLTALEPFIMLWISQYGNIKG